MSQQLVQLLGGDWLCEEDYSFPSCKWLASSLLLKHKITDGSRQGGGKKDSIFWVRIINFKTSRPEDDFPLASLLPPKSSCYLHPLEKTSKSSYFREINVYLELGLA